mgnify:CR=1 FL=1
MTGLILYPLVLGLGHQQINLIYKQKLYFGLKNINYYFFKLNSKLNSCAEQPYIYFTLILQYQLLGLANVLILSKKKSVLSEPGYTGIDAVTIG